MNTTKIKDVCVVVSGTTPKSTEERYWNGTHVWITPAELSEDSFIVSDSERHITDEAVRATGLKPFPKGTVLLSSRAPIGKVAIAGCDMYCNQGFKNLICSDSIYNLYLYYFLKSKTEYLNSLGRGATFKEISKGIVEDITIPFPAYDEQIHIAKQLQKVTELIALKKRQYRYLDDIIRSRFLEMFGDPAVNSKKLPVVKLGDIAFITKLAGFEYTKYIKYQDHGDIIMVRGLNCKSGKLILDDIYWIDKSVSDLLPRSKLAKGDIVMTYVGTVGEVAIVDKDDTYHLAPNVAKISLYDKKTNNPYFWNYMFTISKNYILRFASTTTQSALGMEKIRKIPFIVPETEDQNRFVGLLTQVDKSKMAVQKSLDELETLKKSLMQTYFG